MRIKKPTKIALNMARRIITGTADSGKAVAKLIKDNPRISIPAGAAALYFASPAMDFADKQRAKMMLQNQRQGKYNDYT